MYQAAAFRQIVPLLHSNQVGAPLGLRHPDSATDLGAMRTKSLIGSAEIQLNVSFKRAGTCTSEDLTRCQASVCQSEKMK